MLIELDAIHDRVGITFIYVTHDQQEAISVSDRVAVMNEGSVLQIGSPKEIYEHPADGFVARFIGETNLFEGQVVHIEDQRVVAKVAGLGDITAKTEKAVALNDRVLITVRPERIRIAKVAPGQDENSVNCIDGRIEEIIYSSARSALFVKLGSGMQVQAVRQHLDELPQSHDVTYKDHVYAWWGADDGYLVEPGENARQGAGR